MPAPDHLNKDQLALFYTGRELRGLINKSTDLDSGEDMDAMWNRKVEESLWEGRAGHGANVHRSLSEKGWEGEPLELNHGDDEYSRWITDGHHRVAAAADIEDTTGKLIFIPVNHSTDQYNSDVLSYRSTSDRWHRRRSSWKQRSS